MSWRRWATAPARMTNGVFEHIAQRGLEREQVLVREPGRDLALVLRDLALLGVLMAVSVARIWMEPDGWPRIVADLVIALFAGWAIAGGMRRRLAYRNGWLAGRLQMVSAMSEAQRRGMSPSEWLESELQRDATVLGVPMAPPPSGSHDDL